MEGEYLHTSLFQDCSTHCEAYGACGGYKITAPCGCAWEYKSPLRYQCHKCYVLCRDRGLYSPDESLLVKDFETEIGNGLSLEQVVLTQQKQSFPRYIPICASITHGNTKISDWIAVDIRCLFNFPHSKPAVLKPIFKDSTTLRDYLNVTPDCKLMAVLNGEDKFLEKFWSSSRTQILRHLYSIGFSVCTAPTFSITRLTTEETLVPYSHHTAMLMRHHKVMAEIIDAGFYTIPNLYWIDDDKREMSRWVEWLKSNQEVYTLSRDFTSTRNWATIKSKLKELVFLLNNVGRKFHILIIGTGFANAKLVKNFLVDSGHEVTIVTAAPWHKGIHGSKYVLDELGKPLSTSSDPFEYSIPELIDYNIAVLKKHLEDE